MAKLTALVTAAIGITLLFGSAYTIPALAAGSTIRLSKPIEVRRLNSTMTLVCLCRACASSTKHRGRR
jgi:hypothetical protein